MLQVKHFKPFCVMENAHTRRSRLNSMAVMTVSHWTSACVCVCNLHASHCFASWLNSAVKPVLWANGLNLGLVCLSIRIDECIPLHVVYECEFKAGQIKLSTCAETERGSGSISLRYQRCCCSSNYGNLCGI